MKMTKSIANSFKTFGRSFLLCGLCGWCMEILFTALHSLRRRDLRLTGNTSLWMFPIYGPACLHPSNGYLHTCTSVVPDAGCSIWQ